MLEQSEGYNPTSFVTEDWSKLSDDLSLVFEEIFNPIYVSTLKKL